MTPRTPTGPRFTPRELPAPDVATYAAEKFRDPGMPCEGTAILHTSARNAAERARGQGVVEELGPNRCKVTLGSWSWTGLAATFAMYETDLDIVGPAELRSAAADLGQRLTKSSRADE